MKTETNMKFDKLDNKLDTKFESMQAENSFKFDKLNTKFDSMQTGTNLKFDKLNDKFDTKFESMQAENSFKFDKLNTKFESLRNEFVSLKDDISRESIHRDKQEKHLRTSNNWTVVFMSSILLLILGKLFI
jgi:hypothetical protein